MELLDLTSTSGGASAFTEQRPAADDPRIEVQRLVRRSQATPRHVCVRAKAVATWHRATTMGGDTALQTCPGHSSHRFSASRASSVELIQLSG
jgi:hypothetical protein